MSKFINIMPMAGLGKRFLNSNYKLPKALINISDKPMFIQAAKSMPSSNSNIFICNKKLIDYFKINKILINKFNKKFKLISVKRTTKGQANTCMLATKFLNNDDSIFVQSCDSLITYSKTKLIDLVNNSDAVILTTKPNKIHLANINSYGWVSIKNKKIINITCKKQASNSPYNDKVIIGSFAFKSKKIFSRMIRNLFKIKKKINNEYYIDMAFSHALKNNMNIKNLTVKSYESWGTPQELKNWETKIVKNK